jgi:hypothetical protein
MAHHRFIAQFEITLAEPGNTNTAAPDPMTDDLVQDLIKEITNKANPHDRNGKPYKVEKAKKK